MIEKINIRDLISELESLAKAKDLLDYILVYYDVYTGDFSNIPAWDKSYEKDSLNTRIRNYINFDDSE